MAAATNRLNLQKNSFAFNPYFFLPFIAWVVVGAMLLVVFSKTDLFVVVNGHYSGTADALMLPLTKLGQAEVIVPLLLALMLLRRYRTLPFFVLNISCNLLPFLTQQGLKRVFSHPRPLEYFNHAPWVHHLPHWPELLYNSFPSGHTQGAFSFGCFVTLLLPRKWAPLGVVFFLLGLTVAYSRIYLAAHFFEDVYFGSILGTLLTTGIFLTVVELYRRKGKAVFSYE
jgi:membrane-associated phospholipid phosphatase